MTTKILSALHLASWDQASAWARGRRFPCEQCTCYQAKGRCRHYIECKSDGRNLGIVFFQRLARRR